jgi:N,N'-diacetyllegionaminate synthase
MNIEDYKKKVFFIAEIGKNFIDSEEEKTAEEYLEKAKLLVLSAKKSGADAVKFQTHFYEDEQLPVQVISSHFKGMDRYNWVKKNFLSTPFDNFWKPLMNFCSQKDITFFSTPMSRGAAIILEKLNVPLWKVGSADVLDFVMLDFIANTKKPIILSTGMSTMDEIEKTVFFLKKRKAQIKLLHCVSKYPCPKNEVNLATIQLLKNKFNVPVGFSDHSLEIEPAAIAVGLGAEIIEKHFTFDRNFWGSDHKVSMLPEEFSRMVKLIRKLEKNETKRTEYLIKVNYESYTGNYEKILLQEEEDFRKIFRKSLVAAHDLPLGKMISSEDIYAMRPKAFCEGLPSELYEDVIGKKALMRLKKYDPITKEVVDVIK